MDTFEIVFMHQDWALISIIPPFQPGLSGNEQANVERGSKDHTHQIYS